MTVSPPALPLYQSRYGVAAGSLDNAVMKKAAMAAPVSAVSPLTFDFEISSALSGATRIGGLLGDATTYHLASGGKAWRARLATDCCRALGVHSQANVGLAIACELVHQASVVHDDIQDGAPQRRGRASVAAKFGAAVALCVGDHLLVSAFSQLTTLPQSPALARLFGAGISKMAAAQAEECSPSLWPSMSWSRYEALIAGKAGAMVVLPLAGAALIAGLPALDIETLSQAACILGMAYQASDDIEDLTADLAAGSLNGVIACGLDAAGATERAKRLDLLAQARCGQLSRADSVRIAAQLHREVVMTRDWVLAVLPKAVAALSACTCPRSQVLAPVIDRVADTLSRTVASYGERLHAT